MDLAGVQRARSKHFRSALRQKTGTIWALDARVFLLTKFNALDLKLPYRVRTFNSITSLTKAD
jgi:hypothetical protein